MCLFVSLFDLLSFQLHPEVGTHGENGVSVQRHAAKDLDGEIEYVLILLVVETTKIALVTLLRLRLARQLLVKVIFSIASHVSPFLVYDEKSLQYEIVISRIKPPKGANIY